MTRVSDRGFSAAIICDSISPGSPRLTTFELTYPRMIHSELMTHRDFSRNAASSRAIPIAKTIRRVESNPFVPLFWGKNQPGMQAYTKLDDDMEQAARIVWLDAAESAIRDAKRFGLIEAHKQIANRILEPFSYITTVLTATRYENFFAQRCSEFAEPHFNLLATMMREVYQNHAPAELAAGQWHLPYITSEDRYEVEGDPHRDSSLALASAARCARVSYLNHDRARSVALDLAMAKHKLIKNGHWSPFEHQAQAVPSEQFGGGNLGQGWYQLRKMMPGEYVK